MGTASVNGGALDRLAGKVTDTSEALVRNWNARIDDTYGRENPENGGVEVDVADASQAVTLEVIHEALFRRVLFCLAPVPVRPRSRRELHSLRTNKDFLSRRVSLSAHHPSLSLPPTLDAFQLHP